MTCPWGMSYLGFQGEAQLDGESSIWSCEGCNGKLSGSEKNPFARVMQHSENAGQKQQVIEAALPFWKFHKFGILNFWRTIQHCPPAAGQKSIDTLREPSYIVAGL
ncbi:MAG: hypothetical protein ACP5SH_15840 [Syntrophobacteraceae bacterium]